MLSSEYTSTVLLRAREEQLQRDAERVRVQRERQAEWQAAHGAPARRSARSVIERALTSLSPRPRRVAERMSR
jgi:hypothetical protein